MTVFAETRSALPYLLGGCRP